jgi:pyruvate,water dikinase
MHPRDPDALYTRPLSWLGVDDADAFGGRSVALGEMVRHMDAAGLWTPQGFAISASGHDRFFEATDVRRSIDQLIGGLNADGSNISAVGAAIRTLILSAEIPPDLRQEIVSHYQVLLEDVADWPLPVAVIASVTPEHMSEAAFGGRPPASLFVQDAATLLDAIRKSYAALFGERALAYRLARAVPIDSFRLAIAIQTMVWANAGGRPRDVEDDAIDIAMLSTPALSRRQAG